MTYPNDGFDDIDDSGILGESNMHAYFRPPRIAVSKRVEKTAVVSYIARTDETIIFGEPPERPTDHKVATWIMKKVDFVGGLIHVTWEWTVVD